VISKTNKVTVMAKTASLNATDRIVSRCTEAGSAAALPGRARTVASERAQALIFAGEW
jgi:hypothetical protein